MRDVMTEKLEEILGKDNVLVNEPMSKHTSFKIGGQADYYLIIHSVAELQRILELSKKEKIPFQIVGNGTNLLVREGGIRGFVAKLELNQYSIDKKEEFAYITVGCGMTLANLAFIALENELTGLENMAGIPGTVGGAIRMNAGAYGREMKDVVISSKGMSLEGKIMDFDLPAHEFSHRRSVFEKNGQIILETTIKLEYGKKPEIEQKMKDYKNDRKQKQPLEYPNAGSIFKRNSEIPTAKLIHDCGLKGYAIGGAEVSLKHAGFIVNKGNATSNDVLELVSYIKQQVKEKFNQEIELEIIVIGEK